MQLWDVESSAAGADRDPLKAIPAAVNGVVFSCGRETTSIPQATTSTVRVWPTGAVPDHLCSKLTTNMSRQASGILGVTEHSYTKTVPGLTETH